LPLIPCQTEIVCIPPAVPEPGNPFIAYYTLKVLVPPSPLHLPSCFVTDLSEKPHFVTVPTTWSYLQTSQGNYWCLTPTFPTSKPSYPAGPSSTLFPPIKLLLRYTKDQLTHINCQIKQNYTKILRDKFGPPNPSNLDVYITFMEALRPSCIDYTSPTSFSLWVQSPLVPESFRTWLAKEQGPIFIGDT